MACSNDERVQHGPDVTRPDRSGPPRSTLVGLGAIGAGSSTPEYVGSFALAAEWADVIMIQRAPPWTEFMEGGHISQETEDLTKLELSLIEQYDLQVFFVIDPTDPAVERSRLVGVPNQEDFAAGLANADLNRALSGYAAYIARNYRPDYLAIGAEIDMYADRQSDQFESFIEAYNAAYAVAKAASPSSLVFPTFQLEDIEGNFGPAHPPRWDLLLAFTGTMDALALTTYPFVTSISSARNLREDYYLQLKELFDGPVIIAGAGYTSAVTAGSSVPGTEEDQLVYLERIRDDAELAGIELVVWLSPFDPPVAPTGVAADFHGIGLLSSDGFPKLSWAIWKEWASRPLVDRSE